MRKDLRLGPHVIVLTDNRLCQEQAIEEKVYNDLILNSEKILRDGDVPGMVYCFTEYEQGHFIAYTFHFAYPKAKDNGFTRYEGFNFDPEKLHEIDRAFQNRMDMKEIKGLFGTINKN